MIDKLVRLDIGSGQSHGNDGWIGIDPFSPNADLRCFMWDLPHDDNTVDEIYSSHALEHVEKKLVLPTLKEWYRVIKPGGKVTLRVPDLEWCCNWFLAHQTTGWDMDVIFGNQAHKGEFHKTGFTKDILKYYVIQAGFTITKYAEISTHSQKTLSVELTKQ
jgi:predicted SAM-dependent methyltransferase